MEGATLGNNVTGVMGEEQVGSEGEHGQMLTYNTRAKPEKSPRWVGPSPARPGMSRLIWSSNSTVLKRRVETHWCVATRGKKCRSVVHGKPERTRLCKVK